MSSVCTPSGGVGDDMLEDEGSGDEEIIHRFQGGFQERPVVYLRPDSISNTASFWDDRGGSQHRAMEAPDGATHRNSAVLVEKHQELKPGS